MKYSELFSQKSRTENLSSRSAYMFLTVSNKPVKARMRRSLSVMFELLSSGEALWHLLTPLLTE